MRCRLAGLAHGWNVLAAAGGDDGDITLLNPPLPSQMWHLQKSEGAFLRKTTELRILALIPLGRRSEIVRQLEPLNAKFVFLEPSVPLANPFPSDQLFDVALIPASLSGTEWWSIWGVLNLLDPRPAILVYARRATFRLWSAVLELGGYDLIVEPFSDRELRHAVLRAAQNFAERLSRWPAET